MNNFPDFCGMMQRVLIYICILTLAIGCKPSKNKQLEKAALEVMEVHDRTMKDHGELFKLKKKLLAIDLSKLDSIEANEISQTILNLEKADKDMMNWMHHYQSPEDIMPYEEQLSYYKKEKKKIEGIEVFTNTVKDKAKSLIHFYSPDK